MDVYAVPPSPHPPAIVADELERHYHAYLTGTTPSNKIFHNNNNNNHQQPPPYLHAAKDIQLAINKSRVAAVAAGRGAEGRNGSVETLKLVTETK